MAIRNPENNQSLYPQPGKTVRSFIEISRDYRDKRNAVAPDLRRAREIFYVQEKVAISVLVAKAANALIEHQEFSDKYEATVTFIHPDQVYRFRLVVQANYALDKFTITYVSPLTLVLTFPLTQLLDDVGESKKL